MSRRTWVKVCGLVRPGDVEAAISAGADAIGLVMVASSPRRIAAVRAGELATIAAGRAEIVLLVEGHPDRAVLTAQRIGATAVQPYGTAAPRIAQAALDAGLGALMPVAVAPDRPIELAAVPPGARPLLDTAAGASSGGTGRSFDWSRARGIPGAIIAGGLDPDNVAAAVAAAGAWGVDASSGLETAPGAKDHGKVTAFVTAAKAAGE